MIKLRLMIGQWLSGIARKLRNNFYIYLASLLTVFVLLDAAVFHVGENMRQKAFDLMVRSRVIVPAPDPDIVIIDINEASLSAMAEEYGRWPWPRQVFGEFLENIERQRPKAVVFDILFSDADIYNPDSDTYFNDVIASTGNTFFPFLRLSPEHDKLSKLKPSMIPGIQPASAESADPDATIAVVLPHFDAALNSARLGTHNIYPDKDGIVREYRLFGEDYGWLIPSLPMAVAKHLTLPLPPTQNILLNWRGKPFTYTYVSFSDLMHDMSSKDKTRSQNEFTNKIVIIGSTAPSLFDLKATAMDKSFPGVEVLATAIDNVQHNDYLRVWRGAIPYILISLLLIWSTTAAFYFNADRDKFTKIFSFSQIGLLTISYIGINLTNTYLDFTGPITWAIVYFSIAKIYALATDRALQRWLAFGVKPGKEGTHALIMPVIIEADEPLGDAVMKKIRRGIELTSKTPNNIELMKGTQSGIWGLFGDMIVISWTYDDSKAEYAEQVVQDANLIINALPTIIATLGLPSTQIRHSRQYGRLDGISPLASQWRTLFAQAIVQLEQPIIDHQQSTAS